MSALPPLMSLLGVHALPVVTALRCALRLTARSRAVQILTIKIEFDPTVDSIRIRSINIGFNSNSVLESVRTLSLISPDGVAPIRIVSAFASVIFPCTIKSRRRFLLAPAHPGGPGKRAVKRLCGCVHGEVESLDHIITSCMRHTHIRYLSAVSMVCQLPPAVHTSPPSFDVRSSGLLCG